MSHDADLGTLSFLQESVEVDGTPWASTDLAALLDRAHATEAAHKAVAEGSASLAAYLIGVTEQELDGSALRLPLKIVDQLENNGAPCFATYFGNPNTGKTNTCSLTVELLDADRDDLLVVSNVRSWDGADRVATSMHDLRVTLLEERDRPKAVVIDEASTHFDARTHRREVAEQWTPAAKRFAKIGVEFVGLVCHTGKDLHPEAKRLTTLGIHKPVAERAEFYERWPADADFPADQLFGGEIKAIEPTGWQYDPDDAAPWAWDLESNLFAEDLDWDGLRQKMVNPENGEK